MQLELSASQANALKKGRKINYKGGAVKKGGVYCVECDEATAKRISSGARRGKATQISGGNLLGLPSKKVKGGDILGSINSGIKSTGKAFEKSVNKTADGLKSIAKEFGEKTIGKKATKAIEKGINKSADTIASTVEKTADTVVDGVETGYEWALENDVGGQFEKIKKAIPKQVIAGVIFSSLVASGMDESQARILANTTAGGFYAYDFGKPPDDAGNWQKAGLGALTGFSGSSYSEYEKTQPTKLSGKGIRQSEKGQYLGPHARDNAKEPIRRGINGGSMKTIGRVHFDPNAEFAPKTKGGAVSGSSFKAGSFKGSGRPKLVKGSPEAKEWARKMQEARRNKHTTGGAVSGSSFKAGSFKSIGSGVSGLSFKGSGKPKLVKGSPEAKEWARKMQEARMNKRK